MDDDQIEEIPAKASLAARPRFRLGFRSENKRLQIENERLRAALRESCGDNRHTHLSEQATNLCAAEAEVARLRDGIEQHRKATPPAFAGKPERRLWMLIDNRT